MELRCKFSFIYVSNKGTNLIDVLCNQQSVSQHMWEKNSTHTEATTKMLASDLNKNSSELN